MMNLIKKNTIIAAIFYIIGLGIGFTFNPVNFNLFLELFLIFAGIDIAVIILHIRYIKKILIYSITGITFLFLGITLYIKAMDTSSPYHISHYLDSSRWGKTTIRGVVIADPDKRERNINLMVRPYEVQINPPFGKFVKIKKGKIIVKLKPELKSYYSYGYADKIEVTGALTSFNAANNPGVVDMKNFYIHQDIWGVVTIKDDRDIKLIGKSYANKIVQFSYNLKKKLLLIIKKTMKFPESAFLGGVTLGLRNGLSYEVQQEFRRTGISHVLAVSGLHVGFIALLFLTVFSLMKIPKGIYAPLVVIALIIFTFITGAKPSTVRASMMFSIMIIFSTYFKGKWQSDLNFSLAVVALFYLIFINPLMIVEAAFVMSYTAVLSISLFATPLTNLLIRHLKGYKFIAFIFNFVLLTIFLVNNTLFLLLFYNHYFQLIFLIFIIASFKIAGRLNRKNPNFQFGIGSLGSFFVGFMGMQFAITLGNVFPISGLYFQKFAVAGIFANWIAIPLIGVIVQLGIIAGLVGLVVLKAGLIINAGNYIFSKFFLWMAHFFATSFPYPVMAKPNLATLIVYYSFVAALVWYDKIVFLIKNLYYRIIMLYEKFEYRKNLIILIASIAIIFIVGCSYLVESFVPEERVKIIFIDTKALSKFGDGDAFLVQLPDNKNILINSGPGFFKFNDVVIGLSVGKTTIAPLLTSSGITTLDAVVIQNFDTAVFTGLIDVLKMFKVKSIISAYNLEKLKSVIPDKAFLWTYQEETEYKRYITELKKKRNMSLSGDDKLTIAEYINNSNVPVDVKTKLKHGLIAKKISSDIKKQIITVLKSVRDKNINKIKNIYPKIIAQLNENALSLKNENDVIALQSLIIMMQIAKKRNIKCIQATEGDNFNFGTKANLKVLNAFNSRNKTIKDSSLVLLLKYQHKKALITGLITKKVLNKVVDRYSANIKDLDILGVPGYGDKVLNPYSFVKLTSPKYAVCHYYYKRGRYFDSSVYLNYHCYGTKFFKTDVDGAIVFNIKNNKIKYRKWIIPDKKGRVISTKNYIKQVKFKKKSGKLLIKIIDVGVGNAYLIRTPDDKNYLINAGRFGDEITTSDAGKGIIVPLLRRNKIKKLDAVFMMNMLPENIGGLIYTLKNVVVKKAYYPPFKSGSDMGRKLFYQIQKFVSKSRILKSGETIDLGKVVSVRVLNPEYYYIGTANDEKNSSLVLKLKYKKFNILITGNITGVDYDDEEPSPKSAEYYLLKNQKKYLHSIFMTIPDNGNRYSSTEKFLKGVNPEYAILSVEKYNRKLPSEDVTSRIQALNMKFYRTDFDGSINIYTDGIGVEVDTEY